MADSIRIVSSRLVRIKSSTVVLRLRRLVVRGNWRTVATAGAAAKPKIAAKDLLKATIQFRSPDPAAPSAPFKIIPGESSSTPEADVPTAPPWATTTSAEQPQPNDKPPTPEADVPTASPWATTTSAEQSPPPNDKPPPSFRRRFFDHLLQDGKFQRGIYRAKPDFGVVNGPLEDQMFLHCALRRIGKDQEDQYDAEQAADDRRAVGLLEIQAAKELADSSVDRMMVLADLWYRISELDLRVPLYHTVFLDELVRRSVQLTLPQSLQTVLYCAVYRRISPEVRDMVKKVFLAEAAGLATTDIDLIAFAAYVLKIDFHDQPAFLANVADVLLDEKLDISDMVNILKFLRQNGFADGFFIGKFNRRIRAMSFAASSGVECCYILQAFASAKFRDDELFGQLQSRVLEHLNEQMELYDRLPASELLQLHPSLRMRAKDIASYLHSLASIGVGIAEPELIVADLKKRVAVNEFLHLPDFLVQCLHALSMQGVYDKELLYAAFSTPVARKLAANNLKDAQRWLYCLFKNCQIEFPVALSGAGGVTEDQLARGLHRDFFSTRYEEWRRDGGTMETVRRRLVEKYGKEAVSFCRQLPHVEICGFEVRLPPRDLIERLKDPKKYGADTEFVSTRMAVEVSDSWTMSVNEEKPLGLAQLKKRLLLLQGWTVEENDAREGSKFTALT
ncbi:hypothetical protein BV898_01576 [Hypsibius exemplaris]|uniref:Uncharacterized protein n=1 Tax=Hypsibius exemplaris TaxID=2072580 RepID=A0A1W0XAS8_HYPEX|nr:hypothetical protein BV898_01576 [Hypsibius exemplaris]